MFSDIDSNNPYEILLKDSVTHCCLQWLFWSFTMFRMGVLAIMDDFSIKPHRIIFVTLITN